MLKTKPERSKRHLLTTLFCTVVGIVVIVVMFQRQLLGVDFTDESYYAAIPCKFIQGGVPFVDETAVHQSASLLTTPLVALLCKLRHGSDGLILGLRIVYLIFAIGIAGLVAFSLRDAVSTGLAALIGLLCVVFAPGNVFSFSYNTLGTMLLSAGLLLGIRVSMKSTERQLRLTAFAAGVSSALAMIAYPTLAVPALLGWGILRVRSPAEFRRAFRPLLIGCVIPVAIFSTVVLARSGPAQLSTILSYQTAHGGGLKKLGDIVRGLWQVYPSSAGIILGIAIAFTVVLSNRGWKRTSVALMAALAIGFPIPATGMHFASTMHYVHYFSFFAPLLMYFMDRSNRLARQLFWVGWVPAAVGGLFTAWSSANGALNVAIGLFPGCVITAALLVMMIRDAFPETTYPIGNQLLAHGSVVALLAIFIAYAQGAVYAEVSPTGLTTRIDSGPFRGLYTTEFRKKFIEDLASTLTRFDERDRSILFFYDFPAGYLFTQMTPASNSAWQLAAAGHAGAGCSRALESYYQDQSKHPEIAVRFTHGFSCIGSVVPTVHAADDTLDALIDKELKCVERHDLFEVFVRRDAADGSTPSAITTQARVVSDSPF